MSDLKSSKCRFGTGIYSDIGFEMASAASWWAQHVGIPGKARETSISRSPDGELLLDNFSQSFKPAHFAKLVGEALIEGVGGWCSLASGETADLSGRAWEKHVGDTVTAVWEQRVWVTFIRQGGGRFIGEVCESGEMQRRVTKATVGEWMCLRAVLAGTSAECIMKKFGAEVYAKVKGSPSDVFLIEKRKAQLAELDKLSADIRTVQQRCHKEYLQEWSRLEEEWKRKAAEETNTLRTRIGALKEELQAFFGNRFNATSNW